MHLYGDAPVTRVSSSPVVQLPAVFQPGSVYVNGDAPLTNGSSSPVAEPTRFSVFKPGSVVVHGDGPVTKVNMSPVPDPTRFSVFQPGSKHLQGDAPFTKVGGSPDAQLPPASLSVLKIDEFSAHRDGRKILIEGVVRNDTTEAAPRSASWTLYRLEGGRWVAVDSGQILLEPNEPGTFATTVESTNGEQFKLEVWAEDGSSSEVEVKTATTTVAAATFVVHYRAPDWNTANPTGPDAAEFPRRLNELGFETQVKITTTSWWFFGTYTFNVMVVSYRCVDWQDRTFDSEEEALAFRDSLPRGTESTIEPS
jgi:hypothetical protein